jgi:hypothetical protein
MMPSKTIDNDTLMEGLLKKSPDYASLRIFGCACCPNLRPYNQNKLAYRSKKCVFIGYSHMHQGVKFLDVTSGRDYISRDDVFDETVFPFSQLHPNAGSGLSREILLLLEHLQNPSTSTNEGGNNCTDLSTNDSAIPVPLSPLHHQEHTGEISLQNGVEISENKAETRVISCVHRGGTTDEADLPRIGPTSDSRGN